METTHKSRQIVTNFIEAIWNNQKFEELGEYIHVEFNDHSLPPSLSPDVNGLKKWIIGTGLSFEHKTVIEELVAEGNKVMLKMRMQLKHIGTWREIKPTYATISTIGYRYFRIAEGKIIEHWALLDGNAIENRLKGALHGCKIQE